jgi:hypothetical protein
VPTGVWPWTLIAATVVTGKINLVDLAGSENNKVRRGHAGDGKVLTRDAADRK